MRGKDYFVTEYDLFDLNDYDKPALPLEDAIREANRLRASDQEAIYTVVPANFEMTRYRVKRKSKIEIYLDFLSAIGHRFGKMSSTISQK